MCSLFALYSGFTTRQRRQHPLSEENLAQTDTDCEKSPGKGLGHRLGNEGLLFMTVEPR